MPPKTHASAFSDARTQAAALDQWKQRNAQHKTTASSLQRKVKQLRSDSETVQKTSQWLQERDSLHREQESCEAGLAVVQAGLGSLACDAEDRERSVELAALKAQLLQRLYEVGALSRGQPRFYPITDSRDVNAAAAQTAQALHLREWLAAEMQKTQTRAIALMPNTSPALSSQATADFGAAVAAVHNSFDQLCRAHAPSPELQEIFASALRGAEDEVQTQLASLQRSEAVATGCEEQEVLQTVCLIIKMGHQARQFNLSAASRAAMAERVTAVYPAMSPAQVQRALDDGLSLRRAHAAVKAALADYQRNTTALLSSCEAAFEVAAAEVKEQQARAEAARARDAADANRHAVLAERRASHAAAVRLRDAVAAERQSAAAAKAAAHRARQAEEFQQRLELLHAFEVQRALLREKEAALQETRARAAAAAKAARMQHNSERVDFRRQQEAERRRAEKAQEDEVRSLQQAKQQALERFFAAVDRQIGVEADPQRVLKATSSSAQTETYTTLAQTTRPSMAGFSDEQIMKDPRVRLYHALLAAGLHTTPYGREVVTRGYRVPPSQMSSENNPLRGQFS